MTLTWLLIVAGAFAVALMLHSITCRLALGIDRVMRFLFVGGAAGVLLVLISSKLYGFWTLETLGAALTYAFLCELYLFLFTMTIGSISSNVLIRLASQEMSRQEIDRRYDSVAMVQQRFERLICTGFLSRCGDEFALTQKGATLVASLDRLRRFFGHSDLHG